MPHLASFGRRRDNVLSQSESKDSVNCYESAVYPNLVSSLPAGAIVFMRFATCTAWSILYSLIMFKPMAGPEPVRWRSARLASPPGDEFYAEAAPHCDGRSFQRQCRSWPGVGLNRSGTTARCCR